MKGRHLRRRFSLQPSFMKEENDSDDRKRDKIKGSDSASTDGSISPSSKIRHKIVVMGATKVGKTSIITQFLYNSFSAKYKKTIEEMHEGSFPIAGVNLTLDILDTSGCSEFPAMRALSISSAEAFILVYDVTDATTFEEVRHIRDIILETKGTTSVPIVVVGNKTDLIEDDDKLREMDYATTESIVMVDWEHGFVECSALRNEHIKEIFKELLSQAKIAYNLSPALRKRRQSMPPAQVGDSAQQVTAAHIPSAAQLQHLQRIQERSLGGKRNSCVIS